MIRYLKPLFSVKVANKECTPPDLSIVHDGRRFKFYRARATLIEINVKVTQKCLAEDYNRNNRKKWHLYQVMDREVLRFCKGSSSGSENSVFTENCQVRDGFDRYFRMLNPIDVNQWDRGISSLNIPKLNLEIGDHCFCFYSEFTPKNECSGKISSWISDSFEVVASGLVAYISGATRKMEHVKNLSCSSSRGVNIDASKSIDPDVGSKMLLWPWDQTIKVDQLDSLESLQGLDGFQELDLGVLSELEQNWCNSSQLLQFQWSCQVYNGDVLDESATRACQDHINIAYEFYIADTVCQSEINEERVMRLCCYQAPFNHSF